MIAGLIHGIVLAKFSCASLVCLFFNASDIKLVQRVADVGSDLKSQAVEFNKTVLLISEH